MTPIEIILMSTAIILVGTLIVRIIRRANNEDGPVSKEVKEEADVCPLFNGTYADPLYTVPKKVKRRRGAEVIKQPSEPKLSRSSTPTRTTSTDASDLLSPMNPLSPVSPVSPLHSSISTETKSAPSSDSYTTSSASSDSSYSSSSSDSSSSSSF